MTENEALGYLKNSKRQKSILGILPGSDIGNTIIKALEELKQYRAIGTLEECRAAMEKQTAKKVKSISQVKDRDSYVGLIGRCPCCGDILEEGTVYCDCGQRLDWSRDVKGEETGKNEENT